VYCIGIVLNPMFTATRPTIPGTSTRRVSVRGSSRGAGMRERARERGKVVRRRVDRALPVVLESLPVDPVRLGVNNGRPALTPRRRATRAKPPRAPCGERTAIAPTTVQATGVAAARHVLIGGDGWLVRRTRFGTQAKSGASRLLTAASAEKRVFSGIRHATIGSFGPPGAERWSGAWRKHGTLRAAPPPQRPGRGGRPAAWVGAGIQGKTAKGERRKTRRSHRRPRGQSAPLRNLHCRETRRPLDGVRVETRVQAALLIARRPRVDDPRDPHGLWAWWPVETILCRARHLCLEMPAWTAHAVDRRISLALLAGSLLRRSRVSPLPRGPGIASPPVAWRWQMTWDCTVHV